MYISNKMNQKCQRTRGINMPIVIGHVIRSSGLQNFSVIKNGTNDAKVIGTSNRHGKLGSVQGHVDKVQGSGPSTMRGRAVGVGLRGDVNNRRISAKPNTAGRLRVRSQQRLSNSSDDLVAFDTPCHYGRAEKHSDECDHCKRCGFHLSQ